MQDIVVFGTGGMAREVHQMIEAINGLAPTWNFVGFLDQESAHHGETVHGFPVLGDAAWLAEHPSTPVVVGIGAPASRRKVVQLLERMGIEQFPTVIHPRAWVGNRVAIGVGVIVGAGTLITTDISIGNHVVLNNGSTIAHDVVIADFVTVAPGASISGSVQLGEGCDLGTGSRIIQGLPVGPWSVIGAGAVVVKPIPPNVTVVGVPASAIKVRAEGWQEG